MSATATNVFGPIVTLRTVEQGVAAFLRLWFLDYLDEVERREGYAPGEIERPRGIPIHSDLSKWSEEQVPCLLVLSSGLTGPPERMGDGSYTTEWQIAVGAVVKDIDEDEARRLSSAYIAAVRTAVMHKQGLEGLGRVLRWRDETYDDTPPERRRTHAVGRFVFDVQIDNTLQEGGPLLPSNAPLDPAVPPPATPSPDPGPWPDVQLPAIVGVTLKSPTEDVTP
jgi:hypothetical protein